MKWVGSREQKYEQPNTAHFISGPCLFSNTFTRQIHESMQTANAAVTLADFPDDF